MLLSNSLVSAQAIMSPQELKEGMIGEAITTTTEDQPTSFNVEIIGVVPAGKGLPPQILARAYGGIIPDTNGVIHGMSGSPVYVNGKLIGAIARGIGNDVLPYKFYITPITAMEKIWEYPDQMSKMNKIGVKEVKVLSPAKQAREAEKAKENFQKDIALRLGKDAKDIFDEKKTVPSAKDTLKQIEEKAKSGDKKKSRDKVTEDKTDKKVVEEAKSRFKGLIEEVKKIMGLDKDEAKVETGDTVKADEKTEEGAESASEEISEKEAPIKVTPYNISISTPRDQRGVNMYREDDEDSDHRLIDKLIETKKKELAETEGKKDSAAEDKVKAVDDKKETAEKNKTDNAKVKNQTEKAAENKEDISDKAAAEEKTQPAAADAAAEKHTDAALNQEAQTKKDSSAEEKDTGKAANDAQDIAAAKAADEGKDGDRTEEKDHQNDVKTDKTDGITTEKVQKQKTEQVITERAATDEDKAKADESVPGTVVTPEAIADELARRANGGNAIRSVSQTELKMWQWKKQLAQHKPLFTAQGEKYSFISGFSPQGKAFLKKMIGAASDGFGNNQGMQAEPGSDVIIDYPLKAGNPLGATVAYGDFSIGATGTVTQVEGNKVLSFGHPMFYKGNVNYFMNAAKVIDSAGGILDGIQVVSIGKIIGRINQDRYAGISGIINEFPASVPVRVKVMDIDNQEIMNYGVKIAYDEDNLVPLVPSIVYGALSRTADRELYGSVQIAFAIANNVSTDGVFRRSNMYYSSGDVGEEAVAELTEAIADLVSNKENISNIYDVNVELKLTSERMTATITGVTVDKMDVCPGEIVTFNVTLQPYRSGERIISIPYLIPKNQPLGPLTFEVKGGGFVRVSELDADNPNLTMAKNADDLEETTLDKLDALADTGRNNEIIVNPIVDIFASGDMSKAVESAFKLSQAMEKMTPSERSKMAKSKEVVHRTKYVVDNVRHITLNVVKKK